VWETADQLEKRMAGSWGTGSHVICDGKPLTSEKKGSWAQGGWKPLTSGKNGLWAQGG